MLTAIASIIIIAHSQDYTVYVCSKAPFCAWQEYLQVASTAQPAFLHTMRRCIAAYLAAQPMLQQSREGPAGASMAVNAWDRNLPATAALLRGLIMLADAKFDGEPLLPTELLMSLPTRCAA